MKDFVKLAAVGIAGYLIGFYEMKHFVLKEMLKVYMEKDEAQ